MTHLTEEQLSRRHLSLGASEVSAAVGMSQFKTPLDLWIQKTTRSPGESSSRSDAGHRFEGAIADWYAELEGADLEPSGTLYHPTEPWISCTPDRIWRNAKRAAQIKLIGVNMLRAWDGQDFADAAHWWRYTIDGAPMLERIQIEWEMLVLEQTHGIREIDLVALTGTDLRVYRFIPDLELREQLLAGARAFWQHVENDTPPEIDGSESWKKYLDAKHPRDQWQKLDPMIPEVAESAAAYLKCASIIKRATEAQKRHRNEICAAIGDGPGFWGDGFKVSWKADCNGKRNVCVKEI
jgi:predicted phage-related endonuclease